MPRTRRTGVAMFIGADLAAIAVAVFAAVTAGHQKSPTGAHVVAVVFGVLALLLTAFAWYARRRESSRSPDYFRLHVEPIELHRGDTVTATLEISDARRLGKKLDLGLVCSEYYDRTSASNSSGGEQRTTRKADTVTDWREPDRTQAQQTLQFTVPPDGPFSYEGGAISWAWRVAVVDRRTRRQDVHLDVAIWVSP
jgi:hypothetical protein